MKNILLNTLILLALSSCQKKMDFSNIENLHKQPLSVIQECVHGKWRVLIVSRWGYIGSFAPINTIVNIDIENNNVVIKENDGEHIKIMHGCLSEASLFNWKKKEVYSPGIGTRPPCYATYVMQFNIQSENPAFENIGWYFDSIKNDTLSVVVDYTPANFWYYENYLFLRVNW